MSFAWRLRKKILKRWARNAFFPSTRVGMLRLCGFNIGDEVYIADDLIIVEELAERGNITIGASGEHRSSGHPGDLLSSQPFANSAIRAGCPGAHRHRRRCVARRRLRHPAWSSHRSGCRRGRKQCGGRRTSCLCTSWRGSRPARCASLLPMGSGNDPDRGTSIASPQLSGTDSRS